MTRDFADHRMEKIMRTYLVTGGAGFIGSNYIHYMFRKYDNEASLLISARLVRVLRCMWYWWITAEATSLLIRTTGRR